MTKYFVAIEEDGTVMGIFDDREKLIDAVVEASLYNYSFYAEEGITDPKEDEVDKLFFFVMDLDVELKVRYYNMDTPEDVWTWDLIYIIEYSEMNKVKHM